MNAPTGRTWRPGRKRPKDTFNGPDCQGHQKNTTYGAKCPCPECVRLKSLAQYNRKAKTPREADEFVVESFLQGDRMLLNRAEKILVTVHWTARGLSASEIAARLGTTTRNVTRFRAEGRKR